MKMVAEGDTMNGVDGDDDDDDDADWGDSSSKSGGLLLQ